MMQNIQIKCKYKFVVKQDEEKKIEIEKYAKEEIVDNDCKNASKTQIINSHLKLLQK